MNILQKIFNGCKQLLYFSLSNYFLGKIPQHEFFQVNDGNSKWPLFWSISKLAITHQPRMQTTCLKVLITLFYEINRWKKDHNLKLSTFFGHNLWTTYLNFMFLSISHKFWRCLFHLNRELYNNMEAVLTHTMKVMTTNRKASMLQTIQQQYGTKDKEHSIVVWAL